MYILIFTVFIAELIIATTIIRSIVEFDVKINLLSENSVTLNKNLETALEVLKSGVSAAKSSLNNSIDFIKRKRNEYSRKVIKNIIFYILMIFCKGKYKRIAILFQLIVAVRDYIKNSEV